MKKVLIVGALVLVAGVAFALTPPPAAPQSDDDLTVVNAEKPAKVKKCTGCHGKKLEGKKKAHKIAGLAKAKILKALGHGIAKDKIGDNIGEGKIPKAMKGIVKKLTDAEKTAIATWIAACAKEGCPE